jgi:hypothetical protein
LSEARSQKPEASSKKQEARSKKQEAGRAASSWKLSLLLASDERQFALLASVF